VVGRVESAVSSRGASWIQSYVASQVKKILGVEYFSENSAVLTPTGPIGVAAQSGHVAGNYTAAPVVGKYSI
jgi:hypothetical protein